MFQGEGNGYTLAAGERRDVHLMWQIWKLGEFGKNRFGVSDRSLQKMGKDTSASSPNWNKLNSCKGILLGTKEKKKPKKILGY